MKKQILTLLAVVALCLGLLPIAASAANAQLTNLVVGGVTVVEDGQTTQTTSGEGWSYDVASNTLTLNGAHLDQAYTLPSLQSGPTGVIYAQGSGTLTVNVIGDSQITASEENVNGIYLGTVSTPENPNPSFSLVLTGSAKLDIDVNGAGNAISATTDITVEKLTLEANIMDENNGGNVFFAGGKTIIQENANLDLYAANNPAIYGGTGVEISGGTVTVEADQSNPIYSSGGDVTITGSANVTATGYYGIVGTNVTISGSAVVDTTSTADCGIYTPGALTISETADVIANGYYAALRGNTGVNITGGVVEASSKDDCGIYSSSGDITITGGTVTAVSENSTGIWTSGQSPNGKLEISGSADVTAISTNEWAVYTQGDIIVSDSATLVAQTSAQNPDHGYGAVYGGNIQISENADVTATAKMYQAVVAAKSASITGGTVYAEADDTAIWVKNNGDLIISSATVTAVSSNSMAISAQKDITISSSDVTANSSGDAGLFSMAGDISITDSQVSATGGVTNKAAILGNKNISIADSDVQVSGTGSGVYTTGNNVSSDKGMTVSNSVIKADTPSNGWGLYGGTTGTTVTNSWLDLSSSDRLTNGTNSIENSVLFEGDTGTVYGSATVPGNVEVPEGKTLNVPANTTLAVRNNTTLTNNGTINVQSQGTVTNNGTIVGDIQNAGTTTNNGIIQGTVTGAGTTTNNGGITQGGNSLQVSSLDALQKVINESVGKTEAVVINLAGNITGDLTVPVNANVTIDGDSKYTIKGTVNCETSTTSADVTNLTLQNLTMDGESSKNWAVISQNQGTKNGEGEIELTGVNSLNLTMNNCTVQNYVKKALYLTNAKNLTISGCAFENNATGEMGNPNVSGDYTIDLNLCGVQDTVATITNSTFTGNCGDKAVIKMAVRGGESDGDATDVPLNSTQGNAAASAKSLTISGCTFNDNPAATADVNIGTDSKKVWTDDSKNTFTNNTTGNFAVTISNNETAVVVNPAYQTYKGTDGNYYIASGNGTEEVKNITVPKGGTAEKAAGGDMTIESTGTTTPTEPEEPEEDSWPFVDVTEDAWYYEAVKYVYENGLMIGTADDTFAPNSTLSRAMVAQILYNLEGQPTADGKSSFTDASGHWAANAIAWAQETGVVSGYENNTFRPNRAVTREELAQMLYNYAQYKGITLPALGDLSKFPDGDEVSDWAQTAMSWANGLGAINGYEDNTLRPGGNTTRAEAASMIMGLATKLVSIPA